ncbi:MAG: hypothetical protein JSS09_06250 [Verrucomicrobia bacterium]|nr:hypothetical protein [Verrucomicrobiota bacterium]
MTQEVFNKTLTNTLKQAEEFYTDKARVNLAKKEMEAWTIENWVASLGFFADSKLGARPDLKDQECNIIVNLNSILYPNPETPPEIPTDFKDFPLIAAAKGKFKLSNAPSIVMTQAQVLSNSNADSNTNSEFENIYREELVDEIKKLALKTKQDAYKSGIDTLKTLAVTTAIVAGLSYYSNRKS